MNPYRPWSGSTEHIDGTLSAILRAARLKLPRFLLNPNLGQETTAEEYLAGLEDGLAMLSPYVPVEGAAVPAALLARVPEDRRAALLEALRQDPRPAYQADDTRVYGMPYAGLDIRFCVQDGVLRVCDVAEDAKKE